MAAYFELISKTTGKPTIFQTIDDEMREHFGEPESTTQWLENWYNTLGLSIALGGTWETLRADWPNKSRIVDWLEQHYTTRAWMAR